MERGTGMHLEKFQPRLLSGKKKEKEMEELIMY